MKRLGAILLSIIILCICLSGCAKKVIEILPTPGVSSKASETPIITPEPTATPIPEPYAGDKISDGLYGLDYMNGQESWILRDAILWKEYVVGLYTRYEYLTDSLFCMIRVCDPVNGKEIGSWELMQNMYGLSDLRVFEDGTLGILDSHAVALMKDANSEPEIYQNIGNDQEIVMSSDGYYDIHDGKIWFSSYDNTESRAVADANDGDMLHRADTTSIIVMGYNDVGPYTAFIDTKTGERTESNYNDGSMWAATGDLWYQQSHSVFIRNLRSGLSLEIERGLEGETMSCLRDDLLSTTLGRWDEEKHTQSIRIYRVSTQELLYRTDENWPLSNTWTSVKDMNETTGRILLMSENTTSEVEGYSSNTLFLMTMDDMSPVEKYRDPALDTGNYIKEIEEEFGVKVYIGEDISDYKLEDYILTPEDDESTSAAALKVLRETMSKFPDGLFREMIQPVEGSEYGYTELHILLPYSIEGNYTGATSSIAGFTHTDFDNKVEYIALSIEYLGMMESNMAHEMMHAMENKITEKMSDTFFGFEGWSDLLPDGVDYNYSYVDSEGNDYSDITWTAVDDSATCCFVDAYAKTYPTEDRARTFEHLFTIGDYTFLGEEERYYPFLSDPMYNKGLYLCRIIRQAFKTVASAEDVQWERMYGYELVTSETEVIP